MQVIERDPGSGSSPARSNWAFRPAQSNPRRLPGSPPAAEQSPVHESRLPQDTRVCAHPSLSTPEFVQTRVSVAGLADARAHETQARPRACGLAGLRACRLAGLQACGLAGLPEGACLASRHRGASGGARTCPRAAQELAGRAHRPCGTKRESAVACALTKEQKSCRTLWPLRVTRCASAETSTFGLPRWRCATPTRGSVLVCSGLDPAARGGGRVLMTSRTRLRTRPPSLRPKSNPPEMAGPSAPGVDTSAPFARLAAETFATAPSERPRHMSDTAAGTIAPGTPTAALRPTDGEDSSARCDRPWLQRLRPAYPAAVLQFS